jgi:hypothetical protein
MQEEHQDQEQPQFSLHPDDPLRKPVPAPLPWTIPTPPDWWRCLRRGGVSGRYEGEMTTPTAGRLALDLRVDIDPRYPNSPVMNRISGDFYNVFRTIPPGLGSRPLQWRIYRESWIVDAPVIKWSRCFVDISGRVRYWKGLHTLTSIDIRIAWGNFRAAGPAEVTFTETGGTTFSYSCPRQSDCFRSITLEVDVCSSINVPPLLPNYDTHAHADRPAGLPQRIMTVVEAYREAGICVTMQPIHTVIDDSDPAFTTWSDSELHDALETNFNLYGTAASWRLWGVMAGKHDLTDSLGLAGVMFDYGKVLDGPGRSPERQGFAVFRSHPAFDNLPAGVPASQAEADALRYFLFVWVHEAGHAFNLLHSWDKGRSSSLSWMNYPQNVTDFWKNFQFEFDDEELIHLRHGDRSEVIFGGDPWSTGSRFEIPTGATAEMDEGAPLELLLRSQKYFDYMEPVVVEFRLRNLIKYFPFPIDVRLRPEFGTTVVYIKRPDGQFLEYKPIMYREATPQLQMLSAAAKELTGADRYSENISLTFDQHGFIFDMPGNYLIRAAYRGSGDILILSNIHQIRVGNPASREADRLTKDFFTQEVGMSLYLGGSRSPFLQKGMDVLEDLADRFSDSFLGAKLAFAIADSIGRPFFRIQDPENPTLTRSHPSDPRKALALTQHALDVYRQTRDRSQNIAYHQLTRKRAEYLAAQDQRLKAKDELAQLCADLGQRGVNKTVITDIKAYAEKI